MKKITNKQRQNNRKINHRGKSDAEYRRIKKARNNVEAIEFFFI